MLVSDGDKRSKATRSKMDESLKNKYDRVKEAGHKREHAV